MIELSEAVVLSKNLNKTIAGKKIKGMAALKAKEQLLQHAIYRK